jgi:hypothetical protein
VKCWLSGEENSAHHSAWWLCVDDVSLEEVRRYRHSRVYRSMGIAYLRLFRRLETYLEGELASEHESRAYLVKSAVEFGGLTAELAKSGLDGAVRNYRASRRGAALPGIGDKAQLNKVLTLMVPEGHVSDTVDSMLETYIQKTGVKPLLLTRTGKAKVLLYVEAAAADRAPYPDVLTWGWVRRITLDVGKTKLKEAGDSLVWLKEVLPASQVELRRWSGAEAWLNKDDEPVPLRNYGAIPALLDAAKAWESTLRAGPGSGLGVEPEMFARVLAAAKRIHDNGSKTGVEHAILAIPVALFSKDGRKLSMAYMQANCEHVLYTYGTPEQRTLVERQYSRVYSRTYVMSVLTKPLAWSLMYSNTTHTVAHDAPVKDYVSGAKGEPKWAVREIRVNKTERAFFSHEKVSQKRGGPQLQRKTATLSFDRAFDQLTGRAPGGLRVAFHAAKSDRIRSMSHWAFDNEPAPAGETPAQRKARWNARLDTVRKEPYVHAFKSMLSPLVLARSDGRTRANDLFKRPLVAARTTAAD